MLERLQQWCLEHFLNFNIKSENLLEITDIGLFIIVPEKELDLEGVGEVKNYLFDKEMCLVLDEEEEELINNTAELQFYLFEWGGKFYCHKITTYHKITAPKLFINVGKAALGLDLPFVNLGVRGEYELLNGMQSYDKWCEKANFFNQKSLGICEKHTLAGTLAFQMECKAKGIKSIIGETINFRFLQRDFEGKLYVKNAQGWRNLLRINNFINVERVAEKYIDIDELRTQFKTEGLFFIISNTTQLDSVLIRELSALFTDHLFFQFDLCELASNERDISLLNNLKSYLHNYSKILPHIFISDTLYTEREYGFMKKKLNGIGKFSTVDSIDQYFKSLDELYLQMAPLFDRSSIDFQQFFIDGCTAASFIEEQCNYLIDLKFLKIPKYPFEIDGLKGEELFYSLIEKGMQEKIIPYCKTDEELQVYFERIETELEVINEGGFQDYFLILYDILSWCKLHMILYGNGRGSASGCLLAYLFDITKVDPVKYNLLFARFLNKSRIKEGLPDIDVDFMSSRRQEVKDYIIQRFGYENTCFTGTYTTLKLKGALKDIGREMGLDFSQINYITAGAIEEREEWNWFDIFEYAQNNSSVKAFILNNYELINNIQIVLNQPKSQSIHASAVIITPTIDQEGKSVNIFDWMPVKLMDTHIVSEWEGMYLDKAGFLKEDILSTSQLDKLLDIITLIKQNRNLDIDPFNLPIDDQLTFQYFQKGLTEDVFHFGSPALKAYCQDVKPDNIQELIAMNALYRPGPMASNAHNDFALIKFGKKQPDYDWGCEEILKPTYGIFTYQEQAIEIVQKVGGFTEAEADNVRRAIGKKILTLMQSYKIQFIQQATERGCPEQEAIKIWKKIEDFSAYSFNRCISGTEKIFRLGQTKTAFEPTIEEMYMIYNSYSYAKKTGHKFLYSKYRTYGYGNAYSMNKDNRLIKNHIANITFAGIREVFLVTTESSKTIKVTNNHKFPTSNGEKLLKDIDIERDLLYVNDGYEIEDTSHRWGTDNRTPSSIGFLSQDTDYTRFQAIERELKANHKSCQKCDKEHRRLEVHHKDKNHSNNVPENCILLCPSCHKKEEYKLGRVKVGEKGLLTKLEKIVSITSIGQENVYDVEMTAPYHTFANNDGIVTCNSHATTYSLTGYACNYLKVHYPLEFWTTSLQHSSDIELPRRIAEMNKVKSTIKLSPPDINNSSKIFVSDTEQNIIYWSIGNIAFNGDVAVDTILGEREKNGNFYSLKEFYTRIPKKSVNKRSFLNLILAGCFDDICDIKEPKDRIDVVEQYCKLTKSELNSETFNFELMQYNWYWVLLQKDMCGFGYLGYENLLLQVVIDKPSRYVDAAELSIEIPETLENQKSTPELEIIVGGVLIDIVERTSKKGTFCNLVLDHNGEQIRCLLWNEVYQKYTLLINESKGKILFISGKKKYDSFRKMNILVSTEQSEVVVL